MSTGHRRAVIAAALAVMMLAACGRRGPPVPPESRRPQAVSDLTAIERSGAVEVSWTVPRRRADNSRIVDPGVARLFRIDDAGAGEPRAAMLRDEHVVGYTELAMFRLQEPVAPDLRGGRITYVDRRGLVYGRRYTYVATTTDAQGRTSPPSARVSITYIAPPERPQALQVDVGDRTARLQWQPPAKLIDGTAITDPLVYEVLRAADPVGELSAIARTAAGARAFEDRGLVNDRTYYYAVRAIRTAAASSAAGEPSERVAVTPIKTTPPAPVKDVTAVPSRGEVRLSWRPSPEPDVASYIVYRIGRSGTPMRVGSVRPPTTTFVDPNVPPGTYRYTVTAQDASARANESGPSNEVTVTVP